MIMSLKTAVLVKKIGISVLFVSLLIGCKGDDDFIGDNPFLIDPLVNINLNLDLPEYNALNFPGGSVVIPPPQGIKGVVVYNINNSQYVALEISDPNHTANSCSRMTIDGIIASCPCTTDDNKYNIVTGQHQTDETLFPMLRYQAIRNGNNVKVTN